MDELRHFKYLVRFANYVQKVASDECTKSLELGRKLGSHALLALDISVLSS